MTPETNKSRRRRLLRTLGYVSLALLCLAAMEMLLLRHHWRAEFHQRVEAIRAAGFPVTGKELDAWYPWPQAGENAANWITAAAALQQTLRQDPWQPLESLVGRAGERPRPAEPLAAETKTLLEQFLRANSQALDSLHEAATIPECRYPVDFVTGTNAWMPHVSNVREGCRLLGLEAILHVENRDINEAIKTIEGVLRVARSLDREPTLPSHLMRMIGASVAAIDLERALGRFEFTEGQLAGLQRAFGDVLGTDGLLRGLAGNRCLSLIVFEKPQTLDRQLFAHLPPVPFLEVYNALGLSAREGVMFLDHVQECIRIAQLPAAERFPALRAVEMQLRGRKGILTSDFTYMPFFIRRDEREMTLIASGVVALAVERYRLACGSLPETLDRLVPNYLAAVPEDPFDGAPVRYKRTDRGFTVYGVGEDGKDDGGKEEPRRHQDEETYDLVFRVERPLAGTP